MLVRETEMSPVPDEGFGQFTLGGVRFHADPNQYAPLTWPRRYSVHQGLGGSVTIQDFGVTPRDVRLLLRSGSQWKDHDSAGCADRDRSSRKGAQGSRPAWASEASGRAAAS